jgi:hypothetical protein
VHGSGALIRWLLGNDVVDDEITLFFCPVIVGQGTRLVTTGPDDGGVPPIAGS